MSSGRIKDSEESRDAPSADTLDLPDIVRFGDHEPRPHRDPGAEHHSFLYHPSVMGSLEKLIRSFNLLSEKLGRYYKKALVE
ncbi:unnamed protein product [Caenorhabditis auriculariae]|uniref:Uncharacterized protein n=1 Tax=Caenorhabditis auriculariae TaxID=2777116 RepID=A0A8S1H2G0_9PELO|nr:unnamed protein product [Caenorhabditis auriculariae]